MARKKSIVTTNEEIYQKFNMLNFSSEILLKNAKEVQLKKILRNINKNNKILDMEALGEYIVIKKIQPINFKVYMKKP